MVGGETADWWLIGEEHPLSNGFVNLVKSSIFGSRKLVDQALLAAAAAFTTTSIMLSRSEIRTIP